jgi:Xaa-Pro aminopeptidase
MMQLHARMGPLVSDASAVFFDAERAQQLVLHSHHDGPGAARPLPPELAAAAQAGRARPLRALTHRLRWRKSPAEQALMRKSAGIAAAAMVECMRASRPGVQEGELSSIFDRSCRAAGAQRMAYPPVVAGGADACTIHYSRNDKSIPGGAAVLLDGGCELYGYCSDVTRTWPVSGKFSGAQRALYEAVLHAHSACVAACRPGATMRDIHALSVRLLCDALVGLGVAPGAASGALLASGGTYRAFYPHSVCHWLGLDTHDCGSVPHDAPLSPGAVLTIEPGAPCIVLKMSTA